MKFLYQARTKEGDIKSGTIEASSREVALDLLQKMGIFVTYLEEERPPLFAKEVKIFKRISFRDLVLFSRQISMMLNSRIPIVEALSTLAVQTENYELKEIIFEISKEVEAGSSLSKALLAYPKIFSPFYVAIVKAGETAGKLPECLKYLADHLEREYDLRSKIRGALTYPLLVLTLFLFIGGIMMFSILPSFEKILIQSSAEIPLITKVVLSLSQFLRKYFLPLILFFILFFLLVSYYLKTKKGKETWDRISLKIPILGQILKYSLVSQFSENFSTLISSGVMVTEALEIMEEIVGNRVYQEAISQIKEGVKKGNSVSSISVLYQEIFPPLFNQMVLVGEKTGNLDRCLMTIANFYRKEAETRIENFVRMLEPLLIIILGGAVGGLMMTVLLPLYKIIGTY
jgi:type IV pilus assembly protein PilC